MKITQETGHYLVKLARLAGETWVREGKRIKAPLPIPEQAKLTMGAFVTVKKLVYNHHELRGCIGYPIGIAPLVEEIIDLSRESTQRDPRFPPVSPNELDHIIFEVSILTPPQKINYNNPNELIQQIEIGKDGLIVKLGRFQGLLLPQVPIEQGWNVEEFISYTCRKAWLPPDSWKKEKIEVQKFQGYVFTEKTPRGEIEEVILSSKAQ